MCVHNTWLYLISTLKDPILGHSGLFMWPLPGRRENLGAYFWNECLSGLSDSPSGPRLFLQLLVAYSWISGLIAKEGCLVWGYDTCLVVLHSMTGQRRVKTFYLFASVAPELKAISLPVGLIEASVLLQPGPISHSAQPCCTLTSGVPRSLSSPTHSHLSLLAGKLCL